MELHQVIAERLSDNRRQCADGEAVVVERGVKLWPVAQRHERGMGAEGSRDDGNFLYGFVDRPWPWGARFTDFIEEGFDRLCEFVACVSSDGQLLRQHLAGGRCLLYRRWLGRGE